MPGAAMKLIVPALWNFALRNYASAWREENAEEEEEEEEEEDVCLRNADGAWSGQMQKGLHLRVPRNRCSRSGQRQARRSSALGDA
ncbi:hypothetical protein KM043_014765 [Ampulex compressa]|nr:hypothetical protein KM043_014765 [Ampulex compressa]